MRIDIINNEGPNVAVAIRRGADYNLTYLLRLNTSEGTLIFEVSKDRLKDYLFGKKTLSRLMRETLQFSLKNRDNELVEVSREDALNFDVSFRYKSFDRYLPGAIPECIHAIMFNKVMTFHGYGTQPNQVRKNFLRDEGYNVFSPHINFDSPEFIQRIREKIERVKPELLIGTSMGGYLAYYMSQEYNIPAILINPALWRKAPLINQPVNRNWNKKIVIILGGKDTDVPATDTIKFLNRQEATSFNIFHLPALSHSIGNDLQRFEKILNLSLPILTENMKATMN